MNPEGKGAKGCSTLTETKLASRAKKEYQVTKVREFARRASFQLGPIYLLGSYYSWLKKP
jgi:hypothetical protein